MPKQLTVYDAIQQRDDRAALDDLTPPSVDMVKVERGRANRQAECPTGRSWVPCQCGRMEACGRKCGWCNTRTKESE